MKKWNIAFGICFFFGIFGCDSNALKPELGRTIRLVFNAYVGDDPIVVTNRNDTIFSCQSIEVPLGIKGSSLEEEALFNYHVYLPHPDDPVEFQIRGQKEKICLLKADDYIKIKLWAPKNYFEIIDSNRDDLPSEWPFCLSTSSQVKCTQETYPDIW
jgi:hypothetical protein